MPQLPEISANRVTKKNKSLKASPELHQEIKRASADSGEKIEVLVERAWRAYKKTGGETLHHDPQSGNQESTSTAEQKSLIKKTLVSSGSSLETIHSSEAEWVRRLLFILRSGNTSAIDAIKPNLVAFEELVRHAKAKGDRDAPTGKAPTESIDATIAELRREADELKRPQAKSSGSRKTTGSRTGRPDERPNRRVQ